MNTFHLAFYASDKPFYEGECAGLTVPFSDGEYGILAHHSNMMAAVTPGELRFTLPDGTVEVAAVSGGILKMENNSVLLLVDTAERPDEIDANRARRAADEAREALLQKKSILDYHSAQARLIREINRLRVKDHYSYN